LETRLSKSPCTTSTGAEISRTLREELDVLLKRRPIISKAIGEARELGDLKENAEYHAAREEQGICEAQIRDIEYKLSVSQVIDVTKMENTGKVIFGTTVKLIDINTDDELTYCIVGDNEADIKKNLISVNSPIARGLIGKLEGDEVSIHTPGGVKEFEIEQVQYI
jgi:transcription elongation factor GreA